MSFEAFLELDNKTTHSLTPVLNGHCPFFAGILNRQVNHFSCCIIAGEDFPLFDSLSNNTVERFNSVGSVNRSTDILRVTEQRIEILPVITP